MSYFFLLPLGLWVFQTFAVLVTRIMQHRWSLGNPGHRGSYSRIEYFGKFMTYDAAKIGVEAWMVAVAIILIATIDGHSALRHAPPQLGGSTVLGALLLGVFLTVIFLVTLSLWAYLEGHQGSRWWRMSTTVRQRDIWKWVLGLGASTGFGVVGLAVAAKLA